MVWKNRKVSFCHVSFLAWFSERRFCFCQDAKKGKGEQDPLHPTWKY